MNGITVIIPTFKDDKALSELLQTLETIPIEQIIITDAESRSSLPSHLVPKSLNVHYIQSPKGRGPQIKAAIARAKQDYIWILHADSQPHPDAPRFIRHAMSAPQIALAVFTLSFDRPYFLLRLFAWFARWDSFISTFGDQGFAFRKADYDRLPLDLSQYPLLEDIALRLALKKQGRVKRLALPLKTSARRFEKYGVWKTQYLNAKILWRFCRGETPQSLYEEYYSPHSS